VEHGAKSMANFECRTAEYRISNNEVKQGRKKGRRKHKTFEKSFLKTRRSFKSLALKYSAAIG
jgi:hypothetical protein